MTRIYTTKLDLKFIIYKVAYFIAIFSIYSCHNTQTNHNSDFKKGIKLGNNWDDAIEHAKNLCEDGVLFTTSDRESQFYTENEFYGRIENGENDIFYRIMINGSKLRENPVREVWMNFFSDTISHMGNIRGVDSLNKKQRQYIKYLLSKQYGDFTDSLEWQPSPYVLDLSSAMEKSKELMATKKEIFEEHFKVNLKPPYIKWSRQDFSIFFIDRNKEYYNSLSVVLRSNKYVDDVKDAIKLKKPQLNPTDYFKMTIGTPRFTKIMKGNKKDRIKMSFNIRDTWYSSNSVEFRYLYGISFDMIFKNGLGEELGKIKNNNLRWDSPQAPDIRLFYRAPQPEFSLTEEHLPKNNQITLLRKLYKIKDHTEITCEVIITGLTLNYDEPL